MAATTNLSYLLLLLIALTSSVIAGPDGTSSVPPTPDRESSLPPSSSSSVESSNATNDKNNTSVDHIIAAEGGPIAIFSTTQGTSLKGEEAISNGSKSRENGSKERNAKPSVPRKGVKGPKIKARKGAPELETNDTLNQPAKEDTKPVAETSSVTETTNVNTQTNTSGTNIPKLNTTKLYSNDSSDHSTNSRHSNTSSSVNVTASHVEVASNATTLKSPTEKHIPKPKPTVTTVDGPEVNEPRLLSRTKSSSPGMPRKIDYIVPVIITVVALPILGAGLFMLYRRGRDCWDKRHYRRMDFLIDGMYND